MKAGIHSGVPMEKYVADDLGLPQPSANAGALHTIATRSPAHAWLEHPRLNPQWAPDESSRADLGSAAHDVLLGGYDATRVVVISGVDNWRTAAARQARDEARANNKLPILEKHAEGIHRIVQSAKTALERAEIAVDWSKAEQTVIWQEGETWCRCRPDLHTDKFVLDLKTTENAAPASWIRSTLAGAGYDIQGAWMARGLYELTQVNRDVVFIVTEIEPPYATSLIGMDPAWMDLARRRIDRALETWRKCMKSGRWPAYPDTVAWAEPPAYLEWSAA